MSSSCLSTLSTRTDVKAMAKELAAGAKDARFGFITATVDIDADALRTALAAELPGVPFAGLTSCRSVIGDGQLVQGTVAAAFWLLGDKVKAAVVSRQLSAATDAMGADLATAATTLLGATPSFAIFNATPGLEEPLLRGLSTSLKNTPLLGGSAADNDISGKWSVFSRDGRFTSGAVLTLVSWPGDVAIPWASGALPTTFKATVTRVEGRVIRELDGKPAAQVYNGWLEGSLQAELSSGASILAKTSFTPLGVMRPTGITLLHPERIVDGTGIACFAAVSKGEQVALVKSTKLGMQGRPASIIARALGGTDGRKPKGVLLAYCAGCMLAIDPDTKPMVDAIRKVIGTAPLAGSFHFGEQGRHDAGKPEHGNLMTGALVLS